jgi:hypothetical protein
LEEAVQALEKDGYSNVARMLYEEMAKIAEDEQQTINLDALYIQCM